MDELIKKAQGGDAEAMECIFNKYRKYIYFFARKYNIPDGDYEDIYQEGSIGLFLAIRNNKFERGYKFEAFAKKYIRNNIFKLLGRYNTKKRAILKNTIHERKVILFVDYINPEEIVISNETIKEILDCLNERERIIVLLRVAGYSHSEIADKLKTSELAIKNLKYRAKKKIISMINGYKNTMDNTVSAKNTMLSSVGKERIVIDEQVVKKISGILSNLEYDVITLRLTGNSYDDIAEKMNVNKKTVWKAIARVRKKVGKRYR